MSYHSNLPELRDLGRLQNDLSLAAWVSFARWLGGITDYPLDWASFSHDQPAHTDLYHEIFECPVRFGAAQNAIAFPAHFLALPNPQTNPVILRIMDDLSERALLILEPIHDPNWLRKARHLISQSLHLGLPSLDQLATQLEMTPRQLRQELKKHNLLFSHLLEETRKHLALGYLRDPGLTYTDIAFMLGFSEQSAFNRAFRRWMHTTPGQYRLSNLNPSNLNP
jgi:AraC-like DNA-binding protein